MSVSIKNRGGEWVTVAGNGKAEYGASTVRRGTIGVPAIAANVDYADQTITFSTPMPDTDYLVDLSLQGSNTHRVAFHVVANTKTVNGFTVRFTPIGIKQTTEVGVSGVADNLSYTLTVARDDTYPNLTKNTAIVDPTASLPNDWNAMQTGYLKNPMPANEATLVYTAFKLYTDTEYNSVLALEDRVSELETKLEELVLGGVIEADTLPAVPDNYIYNIKNTTTIGALFSDIFDYGSVSSGNEYIKKLSKYYISGNASIWQDNDEWGKRVLGTLIFDVPITVPEMVVGGYTFPAGDVSKINIRDGEWNSGGYDGCEFVYTDGSVVGSTNEYGLVRSFAQRADQIIINVPKVYSKGTQLVTMQDFNIFKNTIS